MSSKLKKGVYIAVTLYEGPSIEESTSIYRNLMNKRRNNEPVPLPDSKFSISIDKLSRTVSGDLMANCDTYKIKLKGVVV